MKKSFYVLIFILIQTSVYAQAFEWQWQNAKPNGNDLTDIRLLSPTKVIAFGNASSVLLSTNSGNDWQLSYADSMRSDIWNSFFLDINNGFICGDDGLLMKTTDGGLTWIYKNSGTTNILYDIEFVNSDSGLAVGGAGTIIRTTNGGETWSAGASGTSSHYKVSIVSSNNIYIGSSSSTNGRLLHSTDFGTTWSNVTPASVTSSLYGMYVMNPSTYYITSGANGILITTDAGTTWTVQQTSGNIIYDVKFINATTGFASDAKGIIYSTTNGGTNWTTGTLSSNKAIRAIDFNTGLVFICGNSGNLYSTTDNGAVWTPKYTAVTQDYLRKIYFKTESNGWICGGATTAADSNGFILQTTNGGINWTTNPYNFKAQVYSLSMPSDNVWYAGRSANKIFKTTDAGASFTALTTTITSATHTFWFTGFANDSVGYTGGTSGKVLKTTDGGNSWTDISTLAGFSTNTVYDIAVISADTFFLCGGGGRIVKSTNGGTSFTALSPGIAGTFFSCKFKDGSFGIVGGSSLGVSVTTDGGTTWTPSVLPSGLPSTTSIWAFGLAENYIWTSSINGDILYSPDAGLNFFTTRKPTTNTLDGIAVVGDHMWLAGTGGVIVKGFSDPNVPVELLSFTGERVDNTILLKWSTATETNNLGFEVQRENVKGEWKKLAFINGKGTTINRADYSYTDKNPGANTNVYRLKQIDLDGSYKYYKTIEIAGGSPVNYELAQNYPNPFNPVTLINYSVRFRENVELKVYNILGREIRTLVNEVNEPGQYNISFDAADLPSGVYFYQVKAGSFTAVKKMILLK